MDIAATLEAFYNKVDLLYLTDVIGIVAFAFAGVLIGIRMKCDPVGIFVLAFSTAFGGGIVRDLLIDRRPMYWIANQELVWLVLLITIFTPMIFRFYKKHLSYDLFGVMPSVWAFSPLLVPVTVSILACLICPRFSAVWPPVFSAVFAVIPS